MTPAIVLRAPSKARCRSALLVCVTLMGLACAVIRMPLATAANPQPYKIDWVSSGEDAVDDLLKPSSQLQTLRTTAPVDPFGLVARARADVNRLKTVLESFGYYEGSITITINGLGLDSPMLADALTALPKGTFARVKITPTLGPLYRIGRIEFQSGLPPDVAQRLG